MLCVCLLIPRLVQGHGGIVNSVSFSPDGSLIASGSDDKTVRICSVKDGALVQELKVGHQPHRKEKKRSRVWRGN